MAQAHRPPRIFCARPLSETRTEAGRYRRRDEEIVGQEIYDRRIGTRFPLPLLLGPYLEILSGSGDAASWL